MMPDDCPLCRRVESMECDQELLLEADSVAFFRGPFWPRWPGAVMAVHKGHIRDLHEARRITIIQNELLLAERAVSATAGAARMNVVKFGNACEHLHWHIIPRFDGETQRTKTPWEIASEEPSSLYEEGRGIPEVSFSDMGAAFREMFSLPRPQYFSTALILRRCDLRLVENIDDVLRDVRAFPEEWECLLMRRNYADFGWDTFGGSANYGEFPEGTLRREVREELGWEIGECREVSRQWQRGVLRGFVFVALPSDSRLMLKLPEKIASEEVLEAKFFRIPEVLLGKEFPLKVRGRIVTLLEGRADLDFFK